MQFHKFDNFHFQKPVFDLFLLTLFYNKNYFYFKQESSEEQRGNMFPLEEYQ